MAKSKTKTKTEETKPASTITTEAFTFEKITNREFSLVKLTIEDGIVSKEEILKSDLPMIILGNLKHALLDRLLKLKDNK